MKIKKLILMFILLLAISLTAGNASALIWYYADENEDSLTVDLAFMPDAGAASEDLFYYGDDWEAYFSFTEAGDGWGLEWGFQHQGAEYFTMTTGYSDSDFGTIIEETSQFGHLDSGAYEDWTFGLYRDENSPDSSYIHLEVMHMVSTPEPGTMLLLGSGVAGLLGYRRKLIKG